MRVKACIVRNFLFSYLFLIVYNRERNKGNEKMTFRRYLKRSKNERIGP